MNDVKRIFDIPYHQQQKYPLAKALNTKRNGVWEATSTKDYINKANQISRGLLRLGIEPNQKIAIISTTNRTEWHILDIGISQIGAQTVPIYPNISPEEYQYVLNHSEAVLCFVSDTELLEKVNTVKEKTLLKEVYSFDEIKNCKNWKEVLTLGADSSNQETVDEIKNKISENDLATLIYTSGTTGKPKGVMLSHKNIVSDVLNSACRIPFNEGSSIALSFLPICHILERMVVYLYQYYGISVYFAESIDKMGDNLKEVQPNVMVVVPRVLEKVYDKIYAKGASLTGIKKRIFFWSIALGEKFNAYHGNSAWYNFKLNIARKLVFSKWQEALGGKLDLMVSGSAALQPRLARIFGAAGIPVMEGYGLTETSPVISVNDKRNKGWKIGTVGKVIPNVEVKIADDGEILCKGPNVMMGYYKDDKKTQEVIQNGYFHTEDIGEIDSDGFLKITDRKKEIFKTSGGKYVAPQLIENEMKRSRFIEQIMVIGEGEKMPAAFIQPNFDFIKEYAKRKEIDYQDNIENLINNPKIIDRIFKEVSIYNQKFGKWEQIKKIELTADEWSVDAGHLTPTMKLKRKIILQKYKNLYDKIYQADHQH